MTPEETATLEHLRALRALDEDPDRDDVEDLPCEASLKVAPKTLAARLG